MDHWSQIHVLFPLMEKSTAEVALNLSSKVFLTSVPQRSFSRTIEENL